MNNTAPKISVIMSTYNRKEYLEKSVESILNQTFRDFEFVLVNNGSTDGSRELCEEYAQKDSRIKLINIDVNRGASGGKNRGLDEAKGEYVAFVDDDDYCEPTMVEFLWELNNKYKADISICGSYYDFGDRLEPKYIFDELLVLDKVMGLNELLKREKYNVSPPTKLFRKNLFDGIRFPLGVLVDDIHVIYKVFANADKVVAQGVPLYYFRKHQNNMTSFTQTNKLTPELLNEYLSMYRNRTVYLSEKVPGITERARYSEWSYMISMCDKIKRYDCRDCMEIYDYMVRTLRQNYEELISCRFTTDREKELIKTHLLNEG